MRLVSGDTDRGTRERNGVWVLLIVGGILSATHIWKLSGALPWLRAEIPMSLVLAGLLLAIIQLASVVGGLPAAWLAEVTGVKRLAAAGLLLLSCGSILGATSSSFWALFGFRLLEGVGFLLYVVLAPALISRHASDAKKNIAVGSWATFHGAAALIGLSGTHAILVFISWRSWWVILGIVTLAVAVAVIVVVPADTPAVKPAGLSGGASLAPLAAPSPAARRTGLMAERRRRALTSLRDRNTWIAGLTYTCYSAPWLSVLGFLPVVLQGEGREAAGALGLLAGVVGLANAAGVLVGARLLHAGANGARVLTFCFIGVLVTVSLAFLVPVPASAHVFWITAWLTLFSAFGGVIPAFLTKLAIIITPAGSTPQATLGLMQQILNLGNLTGPPFLAFTVGVVGGWQGGPLFVLGFTVMGLCFVALLTDPLRGRKTVAP